MKKREGEKRDEESKTTIWISIDDKEAGREEQRMKSEEDENDEGMMQVMDGDVGDERRTLFPFSHMKRGDLLPSFSQYHIFMCVYVSVSDDRVSLYQMIEAKCIIIRWYRRFFFFIRWTRTWEGREKMLREKQKRRQLHSNEGKRKPSTSKKTAHAISLFFSSCRTCL